jgi:transposase
LHLIADNYSTHKHPKVRHWLQRHSRFNMHFTPSSSSWLNLVERFFADLTGDVIRAGSFASPTAKGGLNSRRSSATSSNSAGTGQVMPTTPARRRYSATV